MYLILIFALIFFTNALDTLNKIEPEIQTILQKHIDTIPDIQPKYVLNEGLSKLISRQFKDKISVLPLFKMSVKIDRTPVKIPWNITQRETNKDAKSSNNVKIEYKYVRVYGSNASET